MPKSKLKSKPRNVTKKITSQLPDRALEVIMSRFGLERDIKKKTLEEIGKKYGITRERVRQIEASAINMIKKSEEYKAEQGFYDSFRELLLELGGVMAEEELLDNLAKDEATKNHIHFHLTICDHFKKHKENDQFKTRWSADDELAEDVHSSLSKLYSSLKNDDLLPEAEIVSRFLNHLNDIKDEHKEDEILRRWLGISKSIDKNPLGEWGRANSQNVRTRGVKDYAFLVMRRHGSPMHFKEVADSITKTFNKKTHYATCHNELIKDPRFVLVGRGIYALKDWGYKVGTAKDVIREILENEGPLSKEEVIDKVMKERYFKKNTILVNLANAKHFKKDKEGLYHIV